MSTRRHQRVVVKLGGSVLTGLPAYEAAATFLAGEISGSRRRFVAVVSAEFGHTDALAAEARSLEAVLPIALHSPG